MRKIALKKKNPFRGRGYKILRRQNTLQDITTKNGHNVVLNLAKHLVFQEEYKDEEFNAELVRFSQDHFKKMYEERMKKEEENAKVEAEIAEPIDAVVEQVEAHAEAPKKRGRPKKTETTIKEGE